MKKMISWVCLLIFVFMVVGFVLQNHIIDIVDKPTYGSNLPQGDSLDLINKVKPKSVIDHNVQKFLLLRCFLTDLCKFKIEVQFSGRGKDKI